VRASSHLVRQFGGQLDPAPITVDTADGTAVVDEPTGWRTARDVVGFLRAKGALIGGLEKMVEGQWAAVSSDGEGTEDGEGSGREDLVFVPRPS